MNPRPVFRHDLAARALRMVAGLLLAAGTWAAAWGQGASHTPVLDGSGAPTSALWPALQVRTGLPQPVDLGALATLPEGWQAAPAQVGNLGPQREPVAWRVDWTVAPGAGGAWILEIDYPSLDHLELMLVGPGDRRQRWVLGDHHPFSERAVASRAFAVPLELREGQTYRLVGWVRTTGTVILPVRLVRPEAFGVDEAREQLLQGLLGGALLCLLAYVLSHGRTARDRAHVWYALNVLGTSVFFFSYQGLGLQHLWGEWAWARERMTMLGGLLGLGSAFLYVEAALEMATRAPWLSRAMRTLGAFLLGVLVAFASGLIEYPTAHAVNVMLSPVPLVLALPVAWRLARTGDRGARVLLVGWAVFGASALCFTLLQRGLLPAGFWTGHAFQFGSLVELVTWMMLLAARSERARLEGELAVRERDRLATIAHTDSLTGLLNRRGLQQAAAPRLAHCDAGGAYAIYLIDLDRFKPINDQFGHDAGDAVLRGLSERLRACVRGHDLVARLGGDEVVVMAGPFGQRPGADADADAQSLGQKLLQTVAEPFDVDGRSVDLGMTVGYALAPHDGRHLADLLKRADAAMYAGKMAGRGVVRRGAAGTGLATTEVATV